jgi:hypothetical protein
VSLLRCVALKVAWFQFFLNPAIEIDSGQTPDTASRIQSAKDVDDLRIPIQHKICLGKLGEKTDFPLSDISRENKRTVRRCVAPTREARNLIRDLDHNRVHFTKIRR